MCGPGCGALHALGGSLYFIMCGFTVELRRTQTGALGNNRLGGEN
jgi:hypothetical protein